MHEVAADQAAKQAPDGEVAQRLRVEALPRRCADHLPSCEQYTGGDEDAEDLKRERPQGVRGHNPERKKGRQGIE
jgi:hypothetical protein